MADTSSTTTFKADISSLRSEMQAASRAVKVANSEFKAATAGMDSWSDSADGLEAKIKQLQTVLKAQNKQVELAAEELEKTEKEYGKNSAEADRAKIKYNGFKAAAKNTEKQLENYEEALKDAEKGSEDLGEALEESGEAAEQASEGFTVMKGVLANLAAEGIKMAISGLKELGEAAIDAYKDFDEGQDNIIKATGATGEAAEELTESYRNVTKMVVGDMGEIGSTLGEVNTRFGFTGKQLEDTTADFLKFAEITGTDATTAVQLVSRAMGDAGMDASEYGELLDTLAVAAQASGISIDTLTENITKYGAPMRALGFDTRESIALFSSWEKAGVNTEIAFSGMKKAISNWAAEGKDSREEFKKTLEEIENTPDIAEATTKAIEVFGAKAGPDLADAIKEGRFEYEDFISLLETSDGAVENTYAATLDGFDSVQLAIQGFRSDMGSFVGELLTTYQPQIETFISTFSEKLQEAIQWILDNGETIVPVLEAIAAAVGTAFAVDKISKFVRTAKSVKGAVEKVGEYFTGLLTPVGDADEAVGLFGTTLGSLPGFLAAAGLIAVVGGLTLASKSFTEEMEALHGLNAAEEEVVRKASEMRTSYETTAEKRRASIASINSEYGYLEELIKEYQGLVDKNGNVKKGYEDRANFITTTLAEAIGVEKSQIEESISKNSELEGSIRSLINLKKADAVLATGQDAYTEAIQKRTEVFNTYQDAVEVLNDAEGEYARTSADVAELTQAQTSYIKKYGQASTKLNTELETATLAQEIASEALATAQQGYEDAETAMVGYNSTIENYEGLSSAIISGDAEAIADSLENMQADFVSAQTGTKEILEQQLADYQETYDNMVQAVEDGAPGITDAQVEEAANMVEKATEELKKLEEQAGTAAEEAGSEYAEKLGSKEGESEKSAKELSDSAKDELKDSEKDFGTSGENSGSEYASGLEGKSGDAQSAGSTVSSGGITGVNTGLGDYELVGISAGGGYSSGLSSQSGSAQTAGSSVSSSGASGAGNNTNSYSLAGMNGGQGYVDGIKAKETAAYNAGFALGAAGARGVNDGQKSHSPSKLTYQSGVWFVQGYVNGIASQQGRLKDTVKNMVAGVLKQVASASIVDASEVGSKAMEIFSEDFSDSLSYLQNRASYENEERLKDFDKTIENLQAKSDAEVLAEEKASEKKIKALEKAADKEKKASEKVEDRINKSSEKAQAMIKQNYEDEIDLIESMRDNLLESEEARTKAAQEYLNKQIDETDDSSAKKSLRNKLTKEKEKSKKIIAGIKDDAKKQIDAQKEAQKKAIEAEKNSAKKLIAAEEKAQEKREAASKKAIESEQERSEEAIAAIQKNYEKLIQTQEKYRDAYQTTSTQMLQDLGVALSKYQQEATDLINSVINGITTKYDERYNDLLNKQENLIEKVQSAGELFNISGAGVITVNDLQEQTKQISDYSDKLLKIRNKVSSELFDQIQTYDMKEGSAFVDQLLAMSDKELSAYNQAYSKKIAVSQGVGNRFYSSALSQVTTDYRNEITAAFQTLPSELEQMGEDALSGFIKAFGTNTDYMSSEIKTFVSALINTFKQELGIHSPSKVMYRIGEYTGEGFGEGFASMIGYVKKTASEMASLVSQPLEGVTNGIKAARLTVGGYTRAGSSVVNNNYNLVQNNTSPKSLSALETYQARRRQIDMIKAFAS